MVYVSARHLYGIEANSGETVWKCSTESNFLSEPFATSSAVYAASSDGSVYALDLKSGTLLWRTDTNVTSLRSPVVEEITIYVASGDGPLLALSSDGLPISHYDLGSEPNVKPHAVADGVMYVVTRNRHLYAIDMFP